MCGLVSYTALGVADPILVAVKAAGPGLSWLVPLIAVAVVVGLPGVVVVSLYAVTRVLYVMALDGMLPRQFQEVYETFSSPMFSTGFAGVLAAIIAALFPISAIAEFVSIGTLLAFAVICHAVVSLREKRPDMPRNYRVILLPSPSPFLRASA